MVKAEELKAHLHKYLKDREILKYCFDDIRNDTKPSKENIERRQFLAKEILKAGRTAKGQPLTDAEIEDYNKLKDKRSAKRVLTEVQEDINQVENGLYRVIDGQEYENYLRHILYNETLGTQAKKYLVDEIGDNFLPLMYAVFRHAFRYCFYDNSGIDNEQFKNSMNALIYTGAIEGIFKKDYQDYLAEKNRKSPIIERLKEIGESEEEFKDLLAVYTETYSRVNALADEQEQYNKKDEYRLIPQKILNYVDNFTIADTDILNVLTTQKYNVDLSVFKKSDETLKSLSHQDREILDYIVLTLYPNDQTVFSDYQIATGLYKEQTSETVSDAMLKAINESIDRIRDIRIDEGFISAENIGDIKAEVKVNDHLITLRQVDIKHKNKTTWYRIIGDPFYYDYAVKTGKINSYKKQLITRDIKDEHIQHNIKNDTLKMMLTRRIISLKYYKQTIINVFEIYDILGLKDSRDYTKARNKAKDMLEDLQKDYNFKYAFKKKTGTRTINRLILEKYDNKDVEKKKMF